MNEINEFVFNNLEVFSTSPYEMRDTYGDRVILSTETVEFDSTVEYQLVPADTSTGAIEEEVEKHSYLRIGDLEWEWPEYEYGYHAQIALGDILHAVQEHGMPAEEAVRRVFPEAVRVEH